MNYAALQQRHANAKDDAADCLTARGLRVQDCPNVEDAERTLNAHKSKVRVNTHLDELRAKGTHAVAIRHAYPINPAVGAHLLEPVAAEGGGEALAAMWRIRHEELTMFDADAIRGAAAQRRASVVERELEEFRSGRVRCATNRWSNTACTARPTGDKRKRLSGIS